MRRIVGREIDWLRIAQSRFVTAQPKAFAADKPRKGCTCGAEQLSLSLRFYSTQPAKANWQLLRGAFQFGGKSDCTHEICRAGRRAGFLARRLRRLESSRRLESLRYGLSSAGKLPNHGFASFSWQRQTGRGILSLA